MAEHDDRIGSVAQPDLQVVAGIRPTMPDGRHAEPLPEELRHLVGAGVAARLVRRGGFRQHQAFQGGDHVGPVGRLHQGLVHAKT